MEIEIDYTNWRNERSTRTIEPVAMFHTSSPHHPGQQWLIKAECADKGARLFAPSNIHRWGEWDEVRERAMFEDAAYLHYLRVRARRMSARGVRGVLDGEKPHERTMLFSRDEKGEYVAIAYQQAWGGWKLARGGFAA